MKSLCLVLVLSILAGLNEVNTLNILGIFPYEGKSHFFVFQPLLLELAKRGHNVTIISHFPQKSPPKNYNDISIAGKSEILEEVFPMHRSYLTIFLVPIFLNGYAEENCKLLLADENVQNLWKNKVKFDLALVEEFNGDCAKGLAYHLELPVVALTSHMLMPWTYSRLGIWFNPSYENYMFLEGGTKPTLFQRIERTVIHAFATTLYKYYSQSSDQNTLAKYFDNTPPMEELARQNKLTLVYQNFVLQGSTLTPSNFIEVGGYHVAPVKPLPDDIKKFIEESEHGVIFISFGSMLKAASIPPEYVKAIIDATKALPQRVIWKWEQPTLPGNPKNIYVGKWLPQNDILAHPNVLAFYSHCGLLGTTEGIYHGVPIVGMPIFGDQPANAAAIEESGLGIQIQLRDLTAENLLSKFKTVLDPKFRENVKRLSRMWHDRPMSPMDTAIYWIEFTGRHHDTMHLRTRAADVPYYQFFCLDILAFYVLLFTAALFVTKKIFNLVFSRKNKTQTNMEKSKKN